MVRDYSGIVKALMGEYDKTSQPLKRRGLPGTEDMTNQGLLGALSIPALANAVAPVGEYEDGSMGLAFPQILAGPAEAWQRMVDTSYSNPVMDDDQLSQMSRDSFDAAGLAMTGGLGAGLAGGLADDALKATVDLPASAAFKFGDEIFDAGQGRYHANAIRDAVAAKGKDAINATWDQNSGFGDMEGFVSLGGNFQTRKQAADAIRSSGKAGDEFIGDELHASTLNDFRSRGLWANAPTGSSVPLAMNALERAGAELPMDLASRMARAKEMGFDTDNVWYHGTDKPGFTEFANDAVGSRYGQDGAGHFFMGSPKRAEQYTWSREGAGETVGAIYPTHIRGGQFLLDENAARSIDPAMLDDMQNGSIGVWDNWKDQIRSAAGDAENIVIDANGERMMVAMDPRNIRSVNAAFDPAMSDSANLLAANAKTGAAVPLATNALERQPQGIRAYHGSPHDFDRFSLDKIGTGEGAQAYGHGLYFADNEDVARSYRDAGVKTFTDQESYDAYKKAMLAWDGKGDSPKAPGQDGRIYEVNIKANPEDFLDWDKGGETLYRDKINQVEASRDALKAKYGEEALFASPTELARRELIEQGIPGIRYLDGMSRDGGAGTSNYVVFSDDIVEILRKYSNPPTGAIVPAGMEASQGDQDPALIEYLRSIGLM